MKRVSKRCVRKGARFETPGEGRQQNSTEGGVSFLLAFTSANPASRISLSSSYTSKNLKPSALLPVEDAAMEEVLRDKRRETPASARVEGERTKQRDKSVSSCTRN